MKWKEYRRRNDSMSLACNNRIGIIYSTERERETAVERERERDRGERYDCRHRHRYSVLIMMMMLATVAGDIQIEYRRMKCNRNRIWVRTAYVCKWHQLFALMLVSVCVCSMFVLKSKYHFTDEYSSLYASMQWQRVNDIALI